MRGSSGFGPGVPADQYQEEKGGEDGVQHGELGHRQLTLARDVEDRAIEGDDRGTAVDRLRRFSPRQ